MTLSIASYAQSSTDYKLVFDKTDVGSGAIKVRCDFTIDFNGKVTKTASDFWKSGRKLINPFGKVEIRL